MRSKNAVLALGLAVFVSFAPLAAPASAARPPGRPAEVTSPAGTDARAGLPWVVRAWSWVVSVFLEDNGGIVPAHQPKP